MRISNWIKLALVLLLAATITVVIVAKVCIVGQTTPDSSTTAPIVQKVKTGNPWTLKNGKSY